VICCRACYVGRPCSIGLVLYVFGHVRLVKPPANPVGVSGGDCIVVVADDGELEVYRLLHVGDADPGEVVSWLW
jgi:hypothetical protein